MADLLQTMLRLELCRPDSDRSAGGCDRTAVRAREYHYGHWPECLLSAPGCVHLRVSGVRQMAMDVRLGGDGISLQPSPHVNMRA